MDTDQRTHPRFNLIGLMTHITIEPHLEEKEIALEGVVLDLSYSGIKIKLDTPILNNFQDREIRITLTMPESGVPITIHGIIKHLVDDHTCGLQYTSHHDDKIDDFMFECIKNADNNVQI